MIITFWGNLKALVRPQFRTLESIHYELTRAASLKDIVEALGVPHTEVGRLTVAGKEISFAAPGANNDRLDVYPLCPPVDVSIPTLLRPVPLPSVAFAVDMNVGKLATLLRMAGFDTFYHNDIADPDLVALALREQRILLSKDTDLLKRKEVVFGYLVREIYPEDQLAEVVHLFGLKDQLKPLSRCLRCNGMLQPVAKQQIIAQLEPLTKKYYDSFRQCQGCSKIYWPGSHRDRMLLGLKKYADYHDPA
ncbi:Mut7-C RNAse domain-containing protein [Thiovibrio frasassiensis]|uniref:Mut7-C ubiquitin/RNAse domain-containing protein n=1 Tax=Thiovibrio frasassiensis TaxID=2984131 RepID=A0A9X4MNZ1_9BACT|nr:Mut7-C RNAse domain-containing protein [Thiovibrio frasassiensis]MDG4476177.1 Mut7-C ubiquitin/RNAse domain-containing protein [Thiovibrio frasassiensis]